MKPALTQRQFKLVTVEKAHVNLPVTVARSCGNAVRRLIKSRAAFLKTREAPVSKIFIAAHAIQESIEEAFGRE